MIAVENLRVELGRFAVRDVSLRVAEGGFHALLGPTGSGKTVLLEAVAGLVPVTSGRITVAGADVTRVSPEQRGVGIVYQDGGLFPHLDVRQNIAYGLRYHGRDRAGDRAWVERLLGELGIAHLAGRGVAHLSGGEKQRVALARALAVRPRVLLLDEPLSALDAVFRDDIRRLLKELHKGMGITCLLVTHDFSEALYLADHAAIIQNGRLRQSGSVEEVFQRPASRFVARFVGMKNVLDAEVAGDAARVGEVVMKLAAPSANAARTVAFRPEHVRVAPDGEMADGVNVFAGTAVSVHGMGTDAEVIIRTGAVEAVALVPQRDAPRFAPGARVRWHVAPEDLHAL